MLKLMLRLLKSNSGLSKGYVLFKVKEGLDFMRLYNFYFIILSVLTNTIYPFILLVVRIIALLLLVL